MAKTVQQFVAAKAFVIYEGKLLILRESNKYEDGTNEGRYDVPGGRIVPGQAVNESLLREVQEETGLPVTIGRPFAVGEWYPEINNKPSQIVGIFFECRAEGNEVILSDDHDGYEWIDPKAFTEFNIIPNLEHIFEAYNNRG